MRPLEQEARRIGFLLEGYGKGVGADILVDWARELLAASLPENQPPVDSDPLPPGVAEGVAEELAAAERRESAYEGGEPINPMAEQAEEAMRVWSASANGTAQE